MIPKPQNPKTPKPLRYNLNSRIINFKMRFSLFAAVAVASIAATGNAARLQSNAVVQQSPANESWMDQVKSLELS